MQSCSAARARAMRARAGGAGGAPITSAAAVGVACNTRWSACCNGLRRPTPALPRDTHGPESLASRCQLATRCAANEACQLLAAQPAFPIFPATIPHLHSSCSTSDRNAHLTASSAAPQLARTPRDTLSRCSAPRQGTPGEPAPPWPSTGPARGRSGCLRVPQRPRGGWPAPARLAGWPGARWSAEHQQQPRRPQRPAAAPPRLTPICAPPWPPWRLLDAAQSSAHQRDGRPQGPHLHAPARPRAGRGPDGRARVGRRQVRRWRGHHEQHHQDLPDGVPQRPGVR